MEIDIILYTYIGVVWHTYFVHTLTPFVVQCTM